MINPNLALRKAYVTALAGLTYKGVTIPVYEEYLQPTTARPIAVIPVGSSSFESYIILLNQTSNDISAKCLRNDQLAIQVQITTKWPLFKGGSEDAELIGDLVVGRLLTDDGLFTKLELPQPLNCWKGTLEGTINIPYTTDTNSVWVTQLLFTNSVSQ